MVLVFCEIPVHLWVYSFKSCWSKRAWSTL